MMSGRCRWCAMVEQLAEANRGGCSRHPWWIVLGLDENPPRWSKMGWMGNTWCWCFCWGLRFPNRGVSRGSPLPSAFVRRRAESRSWVAGVQQVNVSPDEMTIARRVFKGEIDIVVEFQRWWSWKMKCRSSAMCSRTANRGRKAVSEIWESGRPIDGADVSQAPSWAGGRAKREEQAGRLVDVWTAKERNRRRDERQNKKDDGLFGNRKSLLRRDIFEVTRDARGAQLPATVLFRWLMNWGGWSGGGKKRFLVFPFQFLVGAGERGKCCCYLQLLVDHANGFGELKGHGLGPWLACNRWRCSGRDHIQWWVAKKRGRTRKWKSPKWWALESGRSTKPDELAQRTWSEKEWSSKGHAIKAEWKVRGLTTKLLGSG